MTLIREFFSKIKCSRSKYIPKSTIQLNRDNLLQLLSGSGLEIGALHRPVIAPHLNVQYVDRLNNKELIEQYPELAEVKLVNVNIIDDAELLNTIPDNSQDFVIANHVIEHMANPIKSMLNWQRVLRKGGKLFLAVPDKNYTFDKEREITTVEHIITDYTTPSTERDFKHFVDFALYVSCRTFKVRPEAEYESFAKELWDKQYSIHYHVWDYPSFCNLLDRLQQTFESWSMRIVSSLETAPATDTNLASDEFLFVLEKI